MQSAAAGCRGMPIGTHGVSLSGLGGSIIGNLDGWRCGCLKEPTSFRNLRCQVREEQGRELEWFP